MRLFIRLSFLCSFLAAPLHAADVQIYGVSKTRSHSQTSASTAEPALFATNAFTFSAYVVATTTTSVTGSTVSTPAGSYPTMTRPPGGRTFSAGGQYNTQTLMNAAYPAGNYGFSINVVADYPYFTRTPTLTLPADAYPNTPQVTNFAAAQNIDWTQPFTVNWGTFVGGDTQYDFIQLGLYRSNGSLLWASPDPGQSGALTGAATQVTIPANTLVPGETYSATLGFINTVTANFTAYAMGYPIPFNPSPLVPGVATYSTTTTFSMRAPGSAPVLAIQPGAAGSLNLSWNADIGRTYDLRSSTNLSGWDPVMQITADTATETVTLTPPVGAPALFYRLQPPP